MQILSNPISANVLKSPKFCAYFRKSGSINTMLTSDFRPEVEIQPFRPCAMKNMQYSPYLWPNRQNFRLVMENWGRLTWWWRQILDRKCKYSRFAHAKSKKICNITLIYGWIAEIFASWRKLGSRNTMVTSDLRLEVDIWPFRACAMKNIQYNPYLWRNCRHFRVLG